MNKCFLILVPGLRRRSLSMRMHAPVESPAKGLRLSGGALARPLAPAWKQSRPLLAPHSWRRSPHKLDEPTPPDVARTCGRTATLRAGRPRAGVRACIAKSLRCEGRGAGPPAKVAPPRRGRQAHELTAAHTSAIDRHQRRRTCGSTCRTCRTASNREDVHCLQRHITPLSAGTRTRRPRT